MNTEKIEEAKIVGEDSPKIEEAKNEVKPEVNKISDDLVNRMKRITQRKEPGAVEVKKADEKPASKFWDASDDDFVKPAKKADEPKAETKEPEIKETKPAEKKLTDRAKEGSARTAVGMVELTQGMILKPWINHKFKKKFSPEEIETLGNGVADAEIKELKDTDLSLRNKWDKLMQKRDKLMDRVPLDKNEKADLQEAFYNYFDITEKSMPPEWYLAFALINVTGNRIIDIAFD